MLTEIDNSDPSVLSSRASVKMQNRFVPTSGKVNYTIEYPTTIAAPDDKDYIIESENFNVGDKVAFLRNKLNSRTIELIDVSTGVPLQDSIGDYDENLGTINFSNFTGTLITGNSFIRITAVPANESTITAVRSNLIEYDKTASTVEAVITTTV